jgi:hypothetical protein
VKPTQAPEGVFDAAVVCAVLSVLLLIWTLEFVWVQALATCVFVGLIAAYVAARIGVDEPPKQPVMPRPKPKRDTVSEEEFKETQVDTGLVGRSDRVE